MSSNQNNTDSQNKKMRSVRLRLAATQVWKKIGRSLGLDITILMVMVRDAITVVNKMFKTLWEAKNNRLETKSLHRLLINRGSNWMLGCQIKWQSGNLI